MTGSRPCGTLSIEGVRAPWGEILEAIDIMASAEIGARAEVGQGG